MAVRISSLRKFVSVQAPPPRCIVRRDDESGLTTLEWLLIVAAVAGLAALAVVLVTNVVDDTSEKIASSSARRTAAVLAATEIMRDADRDAAQQPRGARTFGEWEAYYANACNRLEITYVDAGIMSTANFDIEDANDAEATDPVAASEITIGLPDQTASGFTVISTATRAQCYINR